MQIEKFRDGSTRVLMLGDSHGSISMVTAAIEQAAAADANIVVSVGDFGIWPERRGREFLDAVEAAAERRSIPVIVVPGNHDDWNQVDACPTDDDGFKRLRPHVWVADRGQHWVLGARCGWRAAVRPRSTVPVAPGRSRAAPSNRDCRTSRGTASVSRHGSAPPLTSTSDRGGPKKSPPTPTSMTPSRPQSTGRLDRTHRGSGHPRRASRDRHDRHG